MNRILTFWFWLVLTCVTGTTALAQSVIATAGTSFERSGATLTYTVGEVAIATLSSDAGILTQGFIQPGTISSAIQGTPFSDGQVKIFPNPTCDFIYLEVQPGEYKEMVIELLDLSGKSLMRITDYANHDQINLTRFQSGIYYIRTWDKIDGKVSGTKLVKY